eukprot:Em0002g661a
MDSDWSDGSDESDWSDSYDDLSDLEPLPKRGRQSTHSDNQSGEEERLWHLCTSFQMHILKRLVPWCGHSALLEHCHDHLDPTRNSKLKQVLLVKEGLYGVQEHVHWCLDKLSAPQPPTAGQVIPEGLLELEWNQPAMEQATGGRLRKHGSDPTAQSVLCGQEPDGPQQMAWCKLKKLDLSYNPFGDQGAKGLADVLNDHPTLEELRVWGCEEMSGDGVQYLMDAIMSNTKVKMLTLDEKTSVLLEKGRNTLPDQKSILKGQTALDRASDKGVIVIVQELLKFTPNVNTKDKV